MKVIKINNNGIELPVIIPDSILIFAPHPDDELLSCGGTILKYKSRTAIHLEHIRFV